MSGIVTPFVPSCTRQTFTGADVPITDPPIFRAHPDAVSAAAMAIAHANSEDWTTITPAIMDRYRTAAQVGALLVSPEGRRFFCYVLSAFDDDVAEMPETVRRTRVAQEAATLAAAMQAIGGHDQERMTIARMRESWDDTDRRQTGARW